MFPSPRACLALVLTLAAMSAEAQRREERDEPAPKPKEAERLKIGALAGLPRPEGFLVQDLRAPEAKATTPFQQTYKAPFNPFKPPVPLAKYERGVGDAEFNVSPLELLAEKLAERYGARLTGKSLKVHEFSYRLEQVISRQQGMIFIPLDTASVAAALIGSIAGTALMQGKGVDYKLRVKIDAELDGKRIVAEERPMTLGGGDGPERLTRFAIEKFIYRFDEPPPEPEPKAVEEKPLEEKPVEEKKVD
jgi:hypothetical protein